MDSSIGALLLESGKITPERAENVLRLQKELGIRFGEAAKRLRLVSEDDIRFVLARQHGYAYLRKGTSRVLPEVRAAFEPYCAQVEVLRALRSQLMLRWFSASPARKSLAIVSAGPRDGRSYIAANLAVVFAQLGQRTLLVDADLRNPRQHVLFGLDNQRGLSSVLSERTSVVSIQTLPELPSLSILAAGPTPPNPQELLGRDLYPQLLDQLNRNFDVILIDTPDGWASADARTTAVRAGATLMVVRQNQTRVARMEELRRNLRDLGANVVGAVVNRR